MPDTIELLEAIGKDASLRHASADELAAALGEAQASEALITAAATGDKEQLAVELGHRQCDPPQVSQGPGHEEEPDQEDGDDTPQRSPAPDRDPSSTKR
ncbi:hypothetical protein DWU98_17125 [Dyella monticola]|uniref:Uncharacterized protein n=1 Tax=Dyella monticola TaxID=1927958 RepID=A0A370WTN3_9GAMM|nr:hypothetical protein [Dyella monticola]RDS79519.1 hypothetical protein DWU98_17125 [Dyella monticola]